MVLCVGFNWLFASIILSNMISLDVGLKLWTKLAFTCKIEVRRNNSHNLNQLILNQKNRCKRLDRSFIVPLPIGEKLRVQKGRRTRSPHRSNELAPANDVPADGNTDGRRLRPMHSAAEANTEDFPRPHTVLLATGSDNTRHILAVDGSVSTDSWPSSTRFVAHWRGRSPGVARLEGEEVGAAHNGANVWALRQSWQCR